MISPSALQALKAQLRQSVVSNLEETFTLLKEAVPADTPRMGEILTLEGQFKDYKKEKLRRTLSAEHEQLIPNQIRAQLVDLIAALEVADFDPVRQGVSFTASRRKVLYLFLALLLGGLIAISYYWANTADPPAWFPLPANKSGHLLYKIPAVMQLDQEELCLLRIAFDSASIVRDLSREEVKIESIRTSKRMKVELVDSQSKPAFRIRNILEDDEQFIEQGDYTEWRFGVTPLRAGTHNLTLKVSVMKKIGDEYVPKNLSFRKEVQIVADAPVFAEAKFEATGQLISQYARAGIVDEIVRGREDYNQRPNENTSSERPEDKYNDVEELIDPIQIRFPSNATQPILNASTEASLEKLAQRLLATEESVILEGHTDNRGALAYNQALGQRRAEAIKQLLVQWGASPKQIFVQSAGESEPIATNASISGRAQNRRVVLKLSTSE